MAKKALAEIAPRRECTAETREFANKLASWDAQRIFKEWPSDEVCLGSEEARSSETGIFDLELLEWHWIA